jgi:peptidoglycan/LPS O-acetylase OafA/YrhL
LFLALLVAMSHLWSDMLHGPAAYAVWGFFALSGYLMTHVLVHKYGFDRNGLKAYCINRFLRIFPAFWVACILGALVLWGLQRVEIDARELNPAFGLPRNAQEWAFLLTLLPAFPRWNAPVPVANALSVEVGYYLLMPLFACSRPAAWVGLLFGILITAQLGLETDSFGPRYAWFLPAAPAFALGALACHYCSALKRYSQLHWSLAGWLLNVALVLIWPSWPWTVGLYVGTVLSLWVALSLSARESGRFDRIAGELSYPVYLLHTTIGAALLPSFGLDRTLTYAVLAVTLTVASSWLLVLLVDRPLGRLKRSAPQNRPVPEPVDRPELLPTISRHSKRGTTIWR